MAFSVLAPVTGAQKYTAWPSELKYLFLKPSTNRGVSMVLGGLPSGMLKFQVARSTMRSEEHTSELQSLMRISYAVFCLKTKNKNNPIIQYISIYHIINILEM